jgi:hypothetical protein
MRKFSKNRKKARKGKKTNRNRSEAIAVEEDSSGNKHKKQQCRSHHPVCHPLRCPASPHNSSPDGHCIPTTTTKKAAQKKKKQQQQPQKKKKQQQQQQKQEEENP